MKKQLIGCLLLLLLGSLSGCYKETDVAPDLYTSLGKVPQVSVFWAGTTRGTTTVTVDAGSTVNVTVEYISELDVKEIRLYQQVGTATPTLLSTTPASAATFDAKLRNYVVTGTVTAPAAKNSSVRILSEVVGTNGLASSRVGLTVRTRA
jgi:hypothetical protein